MSLQGPSYTCMVMKSSTCQSAAMRARRSPELKKITVDTYSKIDGVTHACTCRRDLWGPHLSLMRRINLNNDVFLYVMCVIAVWTAHRCFQSGRSKWANSFDYAWRHLDDLVKSDETCTVESIGAVIARAEREENDRLHRIFMVGREETRQRIPYGHRLALRHMSGIDFLLSV